MDIKKRPSFTPAGKMSAKARADAEERYRRIVEIDEADDESLDPETIAALEDVLAELDTAVRSLAKSYGMDQDEIEEDLGPPKRRRHPGTTRPLVLDERPEFRFPDSSDGGRAASETSGEADDEDEGKQRRHKSRHAVSKRRGTGPICGPRRWQR